MCYVYPDMIIESNLKLLSLLLSLPMILRVIFCENMK